MIKKILVSILIIAVNLSIQAANTASSFSEAQTKQIEQIVHTYLLNNPQVIIEVAQKLHDQESAKINTQLDQIKSNVIKFKNEVFVSTGAGRAVAGNPSGKITMVEFVQYQCGHCRDAAPAVSKIITDHADVKLVVVEWPFFGNSAVYASKAALAAQNQGKFFEVHNALLIAQDLSKSGVDKVLLGITGLDVQKIHSDMNSMKLDAGLKANFMLAKKLNLVGTPSFMFANQDLSKVSFVTGGGASIDDDLNNSLKEVL